ncbi:DUF5063 domain-containing protein [Luteolibacter flavescens]|uniref:DUF5063 domain-containing protein n=1 Tax=Luteolibacter flavescens TaxID=1859460 RepID=A0ABT3FTC7_9BACT|nr:DUF5063 domain-containing protein [Luteolibacter flavescens]MCW1886833.1 DUF5063 domain-containing protein [Luteolibacter flavescens]
MDPSTKFGKTVERFCLWAEGDHHTLADARRNLLDLMALIAEVKHLRYSGDTELEFPRRGHPAWVEDLARFGDLPFKYYRVVFDPLDLDSTDEPVTGDLHADFADIYADLWEGLQAYQSGHIDEAVATWVDSYVIHWGYHARSALLAIDAQFVSYR